MAYLCYCELLTRYGRSATRRKVSILRANGEIVGTIRARCRQWMHYFLENELFTFRIIKNCEKITNKQTNFEIKYRKLNEYNTMIANSKMSDKRIVLNIQNYYLKVI